MEYKEPQLDLVPVEEPPLYDVDIIRRGILAETALGRYEVVELSPHEEHLYEMWRMGLWG